jgi:hypothetical protein
MLNKANIYIIDYIGLISAAITPSFNNNKNYYTFSNSNFTGLIILSVFLILIVLGIFKKQFTDYLIYGIRVIYVAVIIEWIIYRIIS